MFKDKFLIFISKLLIVSNKSDTSNKVLFYVQILAWVFLIFDVFFYEPNGGSQDPSGMGAGLHGLYITLPLFIFIFIVNLILIFKKSQNKKYKVSGLVSIVLLSTLFFSII